MKQRRSFSLIEAIKTLVIFLLIVLMLVLVILLVIGRSNTTEETLPQADRMVVYASGVQSRYASGMDSTRVSPYLIAYRRSGQDVRVLHASDLAEKPYEALYPLLRELFGSDAVGTALDADCGAALWSVCMELADSIYVRYNGTLPASVIRAYTYSEEDGETMSSVLDERAMGAASYVRELFFVPAEQLSRAASVLPVSLPKDPEAVCALTCDDRGEVTLFCPAAAAQTPSAAEPEVAAAELVGVLDAYIASMEALSQGVQTGALLDAEIGYGTALSLDGLYCMPQIVRTRYDAQALLYEDPEKLSAILDLLGTRENDTNSYYTDGAGDRIYLNASGRLTISGSESVIRYVSLQDGGLDLADYLGYASIDGTYLLSEYLRASDKLLSQLEAQDTAFGGEGLQCTLMDVTIANDQQTDTLVLTYGYTYCGIPLLDADGNVLPAMILEAGGGVITYLELYLCHADISEEAVYLLPQSVVLDAMVLESAQDSGLNDGVSVPTQLSMMYLCDASDAYGTFGADWIGLLP